MHKRTGLRKPKKYLKTWSGRTSKDWTRRLTPRLSVGMVDEGLPFGKEGGRKSWYLSLTLDPDLLKTHGPVKGVPREGKTVLLFEDDVIALVQHLIDSEMVLPGEDDRVLNGDAHRWDDAKRRKRRGRA
jgi:hypothetical protein